MDMEQEMIAEADQMLAELASLFEVGGVAALAAGVASGVFSVPMESTAHLAGWASRHGQPELHRTLESIAMRCCRNTCRMGSRTVVTEE